MIEVHNVYKRYGDAQRGYLALRGVSFCIEKGDFVALRGPSGGGKSTLLHLLGAMDRPSQGTVRLQGRDLGSLNETQLTQLRRREVGFVFQSYNLLPTLTALENVVLPLALDGRPERAARQSAEHVLRELGLTSKADSFPAELSGGEAQRVAIARAVALDPAVILADEPTGSLDSENGRIVLELLAELNHQRRLTIVMATHDPHAAAFASRILLIQDGRLGGDCETEARAAEGSDRS